MSNDTPDNSQPLPQEQLEEQMAQWRATLQEKFETDPRTKHLSPRRIAALIDKALKKLTNPGAESNSITSQIVYPDDLTAPDAAKSLPNATWVEKIQAAVTAATPEVFPPRPDDGTTENQIPAGISPLIPDSVIPASPNLPILPCGFYLMYSATAAGKSLSAAALACAYAFSPRGPANYPDNLSHMWDATYKAYAEKVAANWEAGQPGDDVPIWPGYVYLYEARAWPGYFGLPVLGSGKAEDWSGPARFVDRLAYALSQPVSNPLIPLATNITREKAWQAHRLGPWYEMLKIGAPQVLIFDSVTLPMRAYAAGQDSDGIPSRSGEPTMPQGLQPSDIAFCVRMQQIASQSHTAIIGIVNSDLVPFADKLEAVCEGTIEVDGPCVMRIRSRRDRSFKRVDLSDWKANAAAYLNYVNPEPSSSIYGTLGL